MPIPSSATFTRISASSATFVAPSAGLVLTNTGGSVSTIVTSPVSKLHASVCGFGAEARSDTVTDTFTVELAGRSESGVATTSNEAGVPTNPRLVTLVPFTVTVTELWDTPLLSSATVNLIVRLSSTPVSPSKGFIADTVGGVVSTPSTVKDRSVEYALLTPPPVYDLTAK